MPTFKTVRVTYTDEQQITTSINPAVSDEEIKKYFAPGTPVNIGSGPNDNVQRIVKCELLGVSTY